jgi:uncharacterized protein
MKELKSKKALCIYHSVDLDGWMSAAIVKLWAEKKEILIDFVGWNYGDNIPETDGYDIFILCDVSFPADKMYELQDIFHISGGASNFIWCDHHISAFNSVKEYFEARNALQLKGYPEGLRDAKFAACELTWQYFFPDDSMPEIVRLLGRYDCFGHKGTDEEQYVLHVQFGARSCIQNYIDAYGWLNLSINQKITDVYEGKAAHQILESKGHAIYNYLVTEAQQVFKKVYSKKILTESQGWATIALLNKERFNPINFEIDYHEKGYDAFVCYWYDGKTWKFSVYNDDGRFDCSKFAQSFGGGGHKGAAGFISKSIKEWENKN